MSKPIMIPGHPGDLVGIVEAAQELLHNIERTDPDNSEEVRGVALKTTHALLIWLGIVPVPDDDSGG